MPSNINVNGTLFPTASADPTHDALYGKGGYRTVTTPDGLTELETTYRLTVGCLVYEETSNTVYKWSGSEWFEFSTTPKLNSVENIHLTAECVSDFNLSADSVTTVKVKDLAITTAKLQTESVTEAVLGGNSVSNNKIQDGEVSLIKLGFDVLDVMTYMDSVAPSAASAEGEEGHLAYSDSFLYVCITGDTWKRTALSAW